MKHVLIGHSIAYGYNYENDSSGVCNDVSDWDDFFGTYSSKQDAETARQALMSRYEREEKDEYGNLLCATCLESHAVTDGFWTDVEIANPINLSWHDYIVR